jgi:hypothetical protein
LDFHGNENLLKLGFLGRPDNPGQVKVAILQYYPVEVFTKGNLAPKSR